TSTKGMAGMLNTVWIILCVVTFGGVMEASGMIKTITEKMMVLMKNTVSLVASTVGTTIFFNMTLSDQYMAILLPGKMFSDTYKKMGYEPRLLSRTLQDSATVTSVLVPWNTCGVVQSSVLGVATLAYLPYCFFNLITPVITIFIAAIGYRIKRDKKQI
ncbi:MAG: Na+/H+ antiporter NhaC family protein, partial [Bacteroidales bacterium]|nr:Na+/H+ antiporter NhaC family protein [Bacteroidales bacterium]